MGKNQQRRAARRRARAGSASGPAPRQAQDDHSRQARDDHSRQPGERFGFPNPSSGQPSTGPSSSGQQSSGPTAAEQPSSGPSSTVPSGAEQAADLLQAAADAVGRAQVLDDAVRDLVVFAGTDGRGDPSLLARLATTLLMERLAAAYERGWQPADVVHMARARLGNRFVGPVAVLVVQQAIKERAPARAPQFWIDQLSALTDAGPDSLTAPSGGTVMPAWTVMRWGHRNAWDLWHDVATLLRHFADRRVMSRINPPPSAWPAGRVPSAAASAAVPPATGRAARAGPAVDQKKLATIRALLSKAEATEFTEEADAFTAKAQDLMTRYAIDEALLADAADGGDVRSRRVHIDNPYAAAKAHLLAGVGRVNRVKAIWDDEHGIATVVGLPVDLDLTEMLFTSLLVQATRSMTEAGAVTQGGHRLDRSPSFRRAFLLAFATRTAERFAEAGAHAEHEESEHRGNVLPVLARRSAAVEREFETLFPDAIESGARRVDARGWHAGRAAADRAVFARGQL